MNSLIAFGLEKPLLRAVPGDFLQEGACAERRDFALSRVLQSARVAGQARHTVEEAAHGHSRCAGSEDHVPMWRWRRALGLQAWAGLGEGVAEANAGGSEASHSTGVITP